MASTLWRIGEVLTERLKGMSFMPQGTDRLRAIQPDSIVFWKQGFANKDGETSLPQVNTPGLVITPPAKIRAPADAGTNARDDVLYPFLVQLVDTDGQTRIENLHSYSKWLQQIRRACHARSWPEVEIAVYGDVYQSYAEVTDVVDEKAWKRHQKFVSGVAVVFTVREQRGIEI